MTEEIHNTDGRIEHPDVRREETDASFGAIFVLLFLASAVILVIFAVVTVFFYNWRGHESAVKKSSYPLASAPPTDPRALPPLPPGQPRLEQEERLAGVERENVNARLSSQEAVLHSLGSTGDKAFVHIPIEQAMKRLENKLPARVEPKADKAWRQDGLIDSGESNSGREFTTRRP